MSTNVLTANEHGQVLTNSIVEDIEVLEIKHRHCTASVSLYGGQVLTWQPLGQAPVFWMSKSSVFAPGKAIRGGIPLCWPWFGPFNDGGNHGFARTVKWQLASVDVNEQAVTLVISWQGKNAHALWPSEAALTQTLVFGQQFEQHLAMTNLSQQVVKYSGALHSYFHVSDPAAIEISPLSGVKFDCKLTGNKQVTDNKSDGQGPVDRIYYTPVDMAIIDTGLARTIKLSSENTHQWVLWNAGKETVASMADMHSGAEQEYVCLEAANTEWQSIAVGETQLIKQIISIEAH